MLAEDAANFLQEPRILSEDQTESDLFLVLSHMHRIFSTPGAEGSKKPGFPLAAPKLLFYLSNIDRIPRSQLRGNLQRYFERLQAEEKDDAELQEAAQGRLSVKAESYPNGGFAPLDGPKIVEV